MVFVTALEDTFKVLEIFQIDWPSCLKVMMDWIWVVLAIIWICTVVLVVLIWLFTVYQPYLCTTQLMVPNTLRKQEIPQMNSWQGRPFNWKPFQVTTSWIWLREFQECAKLAWKQKVATLKNLKYKTYSGLFNTVLFTTQFHMCSLIVVMSSVLIYNVENNKNKNFWLVLCVQYVCVYIYIYIYSIYFCEFRNKYRIIHECILQWQMNSSANECTLSLKELTLV